MNDTTMMNVFTQENLNLIDQVITYYHFGECCRGALTYDDLYSTGLEALWKAASRFDDSRAQFKTYASKVVRGAILDRLNADNDLVYIPQEARRRLGRDYSDDRYRCDLSDREWAEDNGYEAQANPLDELPTDEQYWPDHGFRRTDLHTEAVGKFGSRNAAIIEQCAGFDGEMHTKGEVAERFNLTEARVNQILRQAGYSQAL